MNHHRGQYGLGGTLQGWSRLTTPTSAQQRRLKLAYRGLLPWAYSRYGVRQWAAPLPWTRVIVKDPFALLSIPAVVRVTGALPVLVYRHPGAVLASFRRMGWRPDVQGISQVVELGAPSSIEPVADPLVSDIATFWTGLHHAVLEDTADMAELVIVAHEELAARGPVAMAALAARCGLVLPPTEPVALEQEGPGDMRGPVAGLRQADEDRRAHRLHNFDRSPADVAGSWRSQVSRDELDFLERYAADVLKALDSRRLRLHAPHEPGR